MVTLAETAHTVETLTEGFRARINGIVAKVNAQFTDVDWLIGEFEREIAAFMDGMIRLVPDKHKMPLVPADLLILMAQKLLYAEENIERKRQEEAAMRRTREEWAALELLYVGGEKPSPPDGMVVCACWDCLVTYRRKHRNSKFCSERCRNEQKAAELRFKKTGTYLPRKAYIGYREEYDGRRREWIEKPYAVVPEIAQHRRDGNRISKSRPTMDAKRSHKVNVRLREEDDGAEWKYLVYGGKVYKNIPIRVE